MFAARLLVLLLLLAPAHAITLAVLPFDVGQGGVGGSGLSAGQWATLQASADRWAQRLTGYQPGITLDGVAVYAFAMAFDGPGNAFAEAGPDTTEFQQGWLLATSGSLRLDLADLGLLEAAGTLAAVMEHELAHVLGFGTLWSANGLATAGSGRYTGTVGVTAFRAEFAPGASFVPVELGGGPATRNLHWNEVDQGAGLTGLTDPLGRDFGHDLMSGWTGPDPQQIFLSNTTLRSFEDLGFTVVPEPSTAVLAMAAIGFFMFRWRPSAQAHRRAGFPARLTSG